MPKHGEAERDDPPIYAELRATFAADRTEWSISHPPHFPNSLTGQKGSVQWFGEDDGRGAYSS